MDSQKYEEKDINYSQPNQQSSDTPFTEQNHYYLNCVRPDKNNPIELKLKLSKGLSEINLKDGSMIESQIYLKNEQIKQLEIQKRTKQALQRKKSLEKLENLQKIYEELTEYQSGQIQNKFHELQEQLSEGLYQLDLQDGSQLENEIFMKIEQIKQLENQKRTNQVLERKKSLEKLQNLQIIYQELKKPQSDEKQSKLDDLQKQLKDGLDQLDLQDSSQLENEIYLKKEQIQKLEIQKRTKQALERKKSLNKLENLWKIYEELTKLQGSSKQNRLNELQKQLNEGLDQLDLQDGSQLENEISIKIEQIKQLENQKRTNQVLDRKKSLEKLQNLQIIYQELKKPQSQEKQSKLDDLQKQLKDGLDQLELQDGSQLENEIYLKKEQIQKLEIQKRTKQALERKKSLNKLENLWKIYEVLTKPQDHQMQNRLQELQKQLNEGLDQLEIQDGSKLESEIYLKKEQIKQLEIQKRTNLALERKKSLDKLENLQKIYEELTKLQGGSMKIRIHKLQEQLIEGLDQMDLQDGSQLENEISIKIEYIKQLENQKRTNYALERKKSLEKLKNLQIIYEELKKPQNEERQSKIDDLQKQLKDGLDQLDLQDGSQLEREIFLKQVQIKQLEIQKRTNQSLERKKSLNKLENLWKIYEELKNNYGIDKIQNRFHELQIQLNEGLDQLELQDGSQLENEISLKKEHIKQLEIQQRTNQALERKKSLEKIENLKKIYNQIQICKGGEKNCKVVELNQELQNQLISEDNCEQNNINYGDKIQNELNMNKLIEAQIDLQQDILNTPECAEKLILLLLHDIVALIGETPKENDQTKQSNLCKQLEVLQIQLQLEGLMNADLKFKISQIYAQFMSYNWYQAINQVEKLLKQLRPLNIAELKRLIDKTVEAAKLIENQDIILFLGSTGAGKSTSIHFLAGSTMKELEVKLKGGKILKYIGPITQKVQSQELRNIKVSPYADSETRYISPVLLNYKQIGMLKDGSIMLCDAPGFGDTAGPEVDIANGIGMVNAIRGCKTVRPVVLASNQSIGDRGEGIRRLVQTLVGLIKKVDDHLYSFSYLFTKFNDKSIDQISAQLTNILTSIHKNNEENTNQQFLSLFEDMVEKTEQQNGGYKIEPLTGKPSYYLKNLIKKKPIENPYEVFEVSITEKSRSTVRDQVNLSKQSIISAIKRNDYVFVKYKLDDMQFLIKTLNFTYLNQIYDESVNYIKDNLMKNYYLITEMFNRNLKKNNKLSIEDIKEYKKCVDQFQQIDELRRDHLGNDVIQPDSLIQNLMRIIDEAIQGLNKEQTYELREHIKIDKIQQVIQDLNDKILKKFENICQQIDELLQNETQNTFKDIEGLINQLTLIKEIQSRQEQIQEKFHQTTQNVYGKMQQIRRDAEMLLSTFHQSPQNVNYEKVFRYVNQLKNAQWMDNVHKDSYNYVMKTISEDLIKHTRTLSEQLQDMDLDLSSWKNLEQAWNYVSQIQLISPFEQTTEQLIKYREIAERKFEKSTKDVFEFIQKTFNLESKDIHSLKAQQQKLENVKKEYKNPLSIQNYLKKHDITDINKFYQNLEPEEKDLSLQLENLPLIEYDQKIDYEKSILEMQFILQQYNDLSKKIENQSNENNKECMKLKNQQKQLIAESKHVSIEELTNQLESFKYQIKIRNSRQALMDQLQKLKEQKDIFNGYKQLLNTSELKNEQEEILKRQGFQNIKVLEKEIESIESNIKNSETFDQDYVFGKLDGQIAEDSLNYLESSKKIRLLREDANKILLHFNKYMKKYEENITKELNSNFQNIKNINEEKINDVFKYAQQIASNLYEIIELQPQKKVFEIIKGKDIIIKWRKTLSANLIELRDQMSYQTVINQNIQKNLHITKALTQIDFFIIEENNYCQLYKQFQSKVTDGLREIYQKIIQLIDNHEFQQVATELLDAEDQPTNGKALEQIKQNINITVDELCETTKSKSISLVLNSESEKQIQNMNEISQNLNKIFSAKKYISKYLNISFDDNPNEVSENTQEKQNSHDKTSYKQKKLKIDQCLQQIKFIIQDKISNYISSIEALINVNDFDDAENKRENIIKIQHIIGHLCFDQKITDEIQKLQNTIETNVEKIVDKYSKMDSVEYFLNPPKAILEKLEIVAKRSISYKNSFNKTKEYILQKIRQQLNEIKTKSSSEREEATQKIQQTLHFLPTDMKDYLTVELNQQREAVLKNEQIYDQELKRIKDNKDVQQLLEFWKRCENNKMDNFKNKVIQSVIELCNQYKIDIENFLDEEQIKIKLVVDTSKKINECKENFNHFNLLEINKTFVEIQEKITKKIIKYINFIQNTSNIDMIEEIKNKYFVVVTFIQVQHESIITKDINLNSNIDSLFQVLSKHFNFCQEKQEQSLEKLNMKQLEESLVFIEKRNEFLKDIKISESVFNSNYEDKFKNNNFQMIIKCRNYEESIDYIQEKLKVVQEEVSKFELKQGSEIEKMEQYKSLEVKLQALEYTKKLKKHFQPEKFDADKYDNEIIPQISKKIKSAVQDFYKLIQKNEPYNKTELENLRTYYENVKSFKQQVKIVKFDIELENQITAINDSINNKVDSYAQQIKTDQQINVIAESLVQMKIIGDNLYSFKSAIDLLIDKQLFKYRNANKNDGGRSIGKLTAILENEPDGIGQIILSEHNIFKGQTISMFNQKTQKHDINYVLQHIDGDNISRIRLKKIFNQIYDSFQKNIKYYIAKLEKKELDNEGVIEELVTQIKEQRKQSKNGKLQFDGEAKKLIPILISLIFSLWSLQDISYYSDNSSANGRDDFILQPHPGQIISILRILGIGYSQIEDKGYIQFIEDKVKSVVPSVFLDKNSTQESDTDIDNFRNNIIQIGTGEGKSITLAVTACILVLLGADVNCACYSQYLSERDYQSFSHIFDQLGITKNIKYGSFTKICEGLINEKGEVRNRVINIIENKEQFHSKNRKTEIRPKILLIDEVDVFFSPQFYGNVYTPLARLKHSTIQQLTDYLWQQRNNTLTFTQAKKSLEFQNCCKHFQGWQTLLEEALKDMITDLQNYEHEYEISEGRIGYKEQDGISYNISFGYKTLFVHYKEHEAEKISKTTLQENIFIGIRCGSFSYAKIPQKFQYIMGVTGTLKSLTDFEKKIVENYNIYYQTFIPSVFGDNKRKFCKKDDVYIENKDNYYKTLIEQIVKKIQKRAVLVFFENQEKLKAFFISKELAPYGSQTKLITEQVSQSQQEKNMLIKNSTTCSQITLISKIFGRGTDFICRDQTVTQNGGIHIISTFFSEDFSEEIQIFGRTARQGQDGTVSLVLLENDLEKFLGSNYIQQLNKMRDENNFYEKLNEKRQIQSQTKYKNVDDQIKQADKENEKAENFLQALNDGKIELIKKHLTEQNKGSFIVSRNISRTICLMDATGSMGVLLSKVKDTVETMFKRASEVLQENNISEDCFQMQFAIYRDYDCLDEILQFSPWESKPKNLREFIKTIEAKGGDDFEEAIEIGLWHANQENLTRPISQVILIGDAPSKDIEAIQNYRNKYRGEGYWQASKFSEITHYKVEAEKLKLQKIPVHCLYLNDKAQNNFEEISKITEGKCQKLDINSENGSQQLTDLITESILNSIGGEELVQSYQRLFGTKSYS
ncbi:hypothetical protein ABPG72_002093 [Tetrahymena utriculariae]